MSKFQPDSNVFSYSNNTWKITIGHDLSSLVIIQVAPQQVLCLEFSLEGFKFLSQSIKCMFGSPVTRIDIK
jgi:hypothetical protein